MKLIVAMTSHRFSEGIIGYKNGLPWPRNKKDMQFFRSETMGKTVIMGRKTYESIGNPLEGRINVVLAKKGQVHISSAEELHVYQDIYLAMRTYRDAYIIGGASIYKQVLALNSNWGCLVPDNKNKAPLEEIIVTWFNVDCAGDTFFPVSKAQIDDNSEEEIVEYFDDEITIVRYKLKPDYHFSV